MPKLSLLTSLLFLLSCATSAVPRQPDEMSPDYLVPAGSQFVLHQSLQVPAWEGQIYFQNGQTVSWRGVNVYIPYCTLKMRAKKESEQSIQPDAFEVTRSYTELFFGLVRAPEPREGVRLAAAGWIPTTQIDFDTRDGMDYKVVVAVMELRSARQPDVICMLCTDWGLPQESAHITINKIRRALDPVITLELSQKPPITPNAPPLK